MVTTERRRRFLTDDLLIGAGLVTFFVVLGVLLSVIMVVPTAHQRVPTLLLGTALGFAMLFGALKVARFRADAAEERIRRTVVRGDARTTVDVGRDL